MTTVMIAGGFDRLHPGHYDHIEKASALGDRLIVVLQSDRNLIAKKGYYEMTYEDRKAMLLGLKWPMAVVPNQSEDGTCAEALWQYRPDVFAKGGDRTGPEAMPQSELDACIRLNIRLVYGIGDLLGSSSRLARTVMVAMMDRARCPLSCPARQEIQGKDGQEKQP